MKTVVIGGGLLGLGTGYELAKAGHHVTVLEAGDRLGGLATDVEVAGITVDRFYHCILNSDTHLMNLIDEVGLSDEMRMHPVKAGFLHDGRVHSISSPLDLLRFPPLRPLDRLRLVRSLFACKRVKDWEQLEEVDVETWLRGLSGDRVWDTVWRPLLSAKFDGNFSSTPATYIWSRTVRMTETRSSGGAKELAGHLVGGYRTLVERLAEKIREHGGEVRTSTPVRRLVTRAGAIEQVVTDDATFDCDAAILTVPLPLAARLLADREINGIEDSDRTAAIDGYRKQVEAIEGYLGVVCVLLLLDRPLSEYYTLYLADSSLPFTAVIESTNLIDPVHVGGKHLVYLPKYVDSDSEIFAMSDLDIRGWFLRELRRIYPDLRDEEIVAAPVFRAPHVEPLHPIGSFGTVPTTATPIDGLVLGSTKHFYPKLNNGDAVLRLATRLATEATSRAPQPAAQIAR
ncbi:MAG TPA: NAD(P)/FAD-dependent oxidoreductase, partial [Thermomicrobiales bacterium]|nr:NAD(P)/FAD-dependent oxidoreductase [Thermomicrobiales bacterium]